jgi:hypothetical protein
MLYNFFSRPLRQVVVGFTNYILNTQFSILFNRLISHGVQNGLSSSIDENLKFLL